MPKKHLTVSNQNKRNDELSTSEEIRSMENFTKMENALISQLIYYASVGESIRVYPN